MKEMFIRFKHDVHLDEGFMKCFILLVIPSLLYGMLLAFVDTIIYTGNPIYYYSALYFLVIAAACVYILILKFYIDKKRGVATICNKKELFIPTIFIQSIFYFIMIGFSYVTMQNAGVNSMLYPILSTICTLLTIVYLPLQIFCFFTIIDGEQNVYKILVKGFKVLVYKYQIWFYALFVLAFIASIYKFTCSILFELPLQFNPYMEVYNIMVNANPYVDIIRYSLYSFSNSSMILLTLITCVYALLMSVVLVYFYMILISAYDTYEKK